MRQQLPGPTQDNQRPTWLQAPCACLHSEDCLKHIRNLHQLRYLLPAPPGSCGCAVGRGLRLLLGDALPGAPLAPVRIAHAAAAGAFTRQKDEMWRTE